MSDHRIEKDSMGEVRVPVDAYYGASTQRAVDNFPISGLTVGRRLIWAFGPQVWIVSAMAFGCLINEVHYWAHRPSTAPAIVRVLQESGVLQAPKHHALHHRAPHDCRYCILTNLLNPALDKLGFWYGLERLFKPTGEK